MKHLTALAILLATTSLASAASNESFILQAGTANKGIVAGQTSDSDTTTEMNPTAPTSPFRPASLGLLGLGAVGLSIWRRKEDSPD